FRQELSTPGGGLPSYPHPRLMPDFWEFPTVSMGLGALNAIYQARFNRYLLAREIADTSRSHVWGFLGDGEVDEPEALGAIGLAAREELDNLTFVINCNLQRLDGPVRGNGKIIQELEAVFRGAGWNVIKVIWGRDWDPLLAQDTDGVLVNKMNTTPDGQFQTYAVETGEYIREKFYDELKQGSGKQAVATTMAFVRLLKDLMKDQGIGNRFVPIIPDEARTFGMDSLFPSAKIYSPHGQTYEAVDRALLLSYKES